MATIDRITCTWSGGAGLPGISTFYALPAETTACADLVVFFQVVDAYIPTGTTVLVPNEGDSIESTTGELVGGWTRTGGNLMSGGSALDWAAGTGARVKWNTSGIFNGRRLRGSTFLCPLTVNVFDNNGTIDSTVFGVLQAGATALANAGSLIIWKRPSPSGAANGGYSTIESATVSDVVTSLRTRRY